MAYVIATYGGLRHSDASRDLVAPSDYLRAHLAQLARVPQTSVGLVVVVRPPLEPAHAPQPGYYDVGPEASALEAGGALVRWVHPGVNEGSYAQLLSAFEAVEQASAAPLPSRAATTRTAPAERGESFDARSGAGYPRGYFGTRPVRWYLWTEDDYCAVRPHFDGQLKALHRRRASHRPGGTVLVGLLQVGARAGPLVPCARKRRGRRPASLAYYAATRTPSEPGKRLRVIIGCSTAQQRNLTTGTTFFPPFVSFLLFLLPLPPPGPPARGRLDAPGARPDGPLRPGCHLAVLVSPKRWR